MHLLKTVKVGSAVEPGHPVHLLRQFTAGKPTGYRPAVWTKRPAHAPPALGCRSTASPSSSGGTSRLPPVGRPTFYGGGEALDRLANGLNEPFLLRQQDLRNE